MYKRNSMFENTCFCILPSTQHIIKLDFFANLTDEKWYLI